MSTSLTRRAFLGATAGMTLLSPVGSRAWSRVQGANDRIRLGLIGAGNRGRQVSGFFLKHPDAEYVAAADVFKPRFDDLRKAWSGSDRAAKADFVEDYRRILDRQDVDAVHIATPDHWHCDILADAIKAGKDVYVEKPLSNTVERAVAGLKAYRNADRVVQLGTQQRSGKHFQEAAKIVQSGQLGNVFQALCVYPGSGYGPGPDPVTEPPAGLNWEMFQGPAPRHAYQQTRQTRWRGYWDYGGGLITDWGVHLTDVALWYLEAQNVGPTLTAAVGQYVNLEDPQHEQSPDAFQVSWQYPDFVMAFSNAVPHDPEFGRQGNYFFGPRGTLHVHRGGYEVLPAAPRRQRPGAPAAPAEAPLEARTVPYEENYADDPHTVAHARNFLDCVKSRQKPVSNLEVGFYATLPTLLGVKSVREGKSFRWDAESMEAVEA